MSFLRVVRFFGGLKVATWAISYLGLLVIIVDPTIKVACIAVLPGLGGLWLQWLTRRDAKKSLEHLSEIGSKVDGINSRMQDKIDFQGAKLEGKTAELIDVKGKLKFEEGHKSGVEDNKEDKKE